MEKNNKASSLHLLVRVKNHLLGLSCEYVREIIPLNAWTKIPKAPPMVRGILNLRGQVIRLLDLRSRFGLISCPDETREMLEMLSARESDHVHWLEELELSTRQQRPFTLALDPAKCAFGKWYYAYQVTADSMAASLLRSVLQKFDLPHRKIHAIGSEVAGLVAKGEHEEAFRLIERTRSNELRCMVELFAEARQGYKDTIKEIAVVLSDDAQRLAITVDKVLSTEMVLPAATHPVGIGEADGLTPRCAIVPGMEELVLLMDIPGLFKEVADLQIPLELQSPASGP